MPQDIVTPQNKQARIISFSLLFVFTVLIFLIAQAIQTTLSAYDLNSMYISFCAGFILFVPLVSLTLHPWFFSLQRDCKPFQFSEFIVNLGLVVVVQLVCFLIWMTDAIAVYSIYVDQNSFLAKAFNINAQTKGGFSQHFYWANLLLAVIFSYLSIFIGILPCVIARIKSEGVVRNFVAAFSFVKRYKANIFLYSLLLALSVTLPLLYAKYLFLVTFPIALSFVFYQVSKRYLTVNVRT